MLSAPYSDKSLIRNALAYATARRMGRFAPRAPLRRAAPERELSVIYVLTEKPKLGDGRLDEADNGFLLELTFDSQQVGEDFFRAPRTRRPILWTDPDREEPECA